VKLISASDVDRLLDMETCIELMAAIQKALSSGETRIPLRTTLGLAEDLAPAAESLLLMPGRLDQVFGVKLLSLFPDNPASGYPAIQGVIVLFEAEHGVPVALVNAASVTAIRTAAASAVATRALANSHTPVLALLGYGVQAASHLQAMCAVRDIETVLVWGPDPERAADFARRHRQRDLQIAAVAHPADAVRKADLICAVSAASEPVIHESWLQPGVHINLVGAHSANTREADSATVSNASVYTEVTEFALAESGDLLLAIADGDMTSADIRGEIGEVLLERAIGRQSPDERTIYISLGNVAQDLAAAGYVYDVSERSDRR